MNFNNIENLIVMEPSENSEYRIRFTSGTYDFSGETTIDSLSHNIQETLLAENYELIGQTLFTIKNSKKKTTVLSDIPPNLNLEVTFPIKDLDKSFVFLILDNYEHTLVDWGFAKPSFPISHYAQFESDSATIYFDIPLIPVSR